MENKKIMWWGTNRVLIKQQLPKEFILQKVGFESQDCYPIRVMATWSKSISLIYIKMARTNVIDLNAN